jgi:hypothetical protein
MRRRFFCALMLLAGCSRTEVPEDLGERLTRECVSIITAAMKVKIDVETDKDVREARNALIFDCIIQRGGMTRGEAQ